MDVTINPILNGPFFISSANVQGDKTTLFYTTTLWNCAENWCECIEACLATKNEHDRAKSYKDLLVLTFSLAQS